MSAMSFSPRDVTPAGTMLTLCTQFLQHLQSIGRSPNTLSSYKVDLEQFAGFAASRDIRLVMHIHAQLVEDWIQALVLGEGMKHRTAARKLETLRGFVRYLKRRNLLPFDPTEGIDVKFEQTRVIAPPEQTLLKVIESIPTDGAINIRDRALLRLMFDGAVRIGGLLSLDIYDEQVPAQYCVTPAGIVIYRAKGGKTRDAVVDDTTLEYLQRWLDVRGRMVNHKLSTNHQNALCLSTRGTRMTRGALHDRIKQHGRRVGVDLNAHLFRHRRLGDIYEKTGDARLSADQGGHANVNTFIQTYGHQSGEVRRQRIRRDAPLGAYNEMSSGEAA